MGDITEQQYYEKLGQLRDAYLQENSDEWRKITVEIEKYNKKLQEELIKDYKKTRDQIQKTYDEIAKSTTRNIDKIIAAQEKLANKLKNVGDLLKDEETQFEDWGRTAVLKTSRLGNLAEDIQLLKAYEKALEGIRSRGAPKDFMDVVIDMDVQKGLDYMNQLLSMSDKSFGQYLDTWTEKQNISERIAQAFYKPDIDEAKDQFANALTSIVDDLPDEMKIAGYNVMGAFKDGLVQAGDDTIDYLREFSGKVSEIFGEGADILTGGTGAEDIIPKLSSANLLGNIFSGYALAEAGGQTPISVIVTGNDFIGDSPIVADKIGNMLVSALKRKGVIK